MTEGGPLSLDYIFHPRSVAIAGVSKDPAGFGGVSFGYLLSVKEQGCDSVYVVNPKYDEIDGTRCYPSVLDIPGDVDFVISCVSLRVFPQLLDDCIAKGVKVVHSFTAGFRETGEPELEELEAEMVQRARAAGMRLLGPNCMGLYVPGSGLAFMQGFPTEPGPVGFISQSGGNAGEMIHTAAARGIRFSKAVSYGNAADIDESELLEYLAEDTQTTIICAYVEGVKDGRRFLSALKKAAAAKPTVVLKGGRTEAGTRAVMSHTASLAGSIEVFDAACRQVNAIRVTSVDELVDLAAAFRFMKAPAGPAVAVVGGGGGFSVFAADEIDDAGLTCPVLPDGTQDELREFMPVAGTSVRNPVDTVMLYEPPLLEKTLAIVGSAANIDTVLFHTSFSWGRGRSTANRFSQDPEVMMDGMVSQIVSAQRAIKKPVVVVLRPPLDVEGMERTSMFQAKCVAAGFPVYSTIPKAANAIAKVWRWSTARR